MAAGAKGNYGLTKWSAAQKREYDAIQKRAEKLGKTPVDGDFDSRGNATGAWGALIADFDAWAKNYGVELHTSEHNHAAAAAGGTTRSAGDLDCPKTLTRTYDYQVNGTHVVTKYTCNLRRKTLRGNCVYSCTYTTQMS